MGSAADDLQRDRLVTKQIHRLFIAAMLQRRSMLLLVYLGHIPAFFIINVLIPLQVAYGMQAILVNNTALATHQGIKVLLLSLFGTVIYGIGTWCNHRVNVDGGLYIQRAVFANYLNKDYDFYGSRFIGSLGADATSIRKAYQEYAYLATIDTPRIIVIIVAGLSVIMYKSVPLGVISTMCVLFVIGITVLMAKLRLTYRREVSEANSHLAGMVGDPLSQGPAVKSFAQELHEQQRLEKPLGRWRRAQLTIYDTSIPSTMVRHILLGLTMAMLLVVSAHLYAQQSISVAIVALVQLYVVRIVYSTVEIGEIIKRYEALMSDAHEPMFTMQVPTKVNDITKPKMLKGGKVRTITFDAVSYRYPEAAVGTHAIQNFSLNIAEGEKIGLVGFSGGGKTTVTKLLLRFMDTTTGTISVNGTNIAQLAQSDLRKNIAYVPQEPLLFHRSIKDNIAYAKPTASNKQVLQAAALAYVDDFVNTLPDGYDSMVGERGVKLSGGQRQRIAIARALLKRAPILVLDEATSALDSRSERYIQQALQELMKDTTAIVIAHRLSTIQHMDRIVVIDNGKIVQSGAHQTLLKDAKGPYAKLWAHQSGGYITEQ